MSYKVIKNNLGTYDILEKNSETIIQICTKDEMEARSICRKMNLGSGFFGWTPNFLSKQLTF
jgi:hypothetical protein